MDHSSDEVTPMYEYGEKSMLFFRGGTFKIIYLEILVEKVPSYFNRGIVIRYILLGKEVSFLE
jgi:hypothetical protein